MGSKSLETSALKIRRFFNEEHPPAADKIVKGKERVWTRWKDKRKWDCRKIKMVQMRRMRKDTRQDTPRGRRTATRRATKKDTSRATSEAIRKALPQTTAMTKF